MPQFRGFEPLGELGRGGMGVVIRARDQARGTVVAMKTIRHPDSASVTRFKEEFRTLAALSHPNLVTLHELFNDGDVWFFTMEYVDGIDLLAHVRAFGEPGHGGHGC